MDPSKTEEGVMDSLLKALNSGDAFRGEARRKRVAPGRFHCRKGGAYENILKSVFTFIAVFDLNQGEATGCLREL